LWSSLGTDYAKTKAPEAVEAWTEAEARRATQSALTVGPGAATSNMILVTGRPLRIDARAIGIIVRVIIVTAPFQNIALHIH